MAMENRAFKERITPDRADEVSHLLAILRDFRSEIMGALSSHMEKEEAAYQRQSAELARLADEVDALASITKAFPYLPDGTPDFYGHRKDHELRIQSEKDSHDMAVEAKKTVISVVIKHAPEAAKWGLIAYFGLHFVGTGS